LRSRAQVTDIVLECVCELPIKTPVYAALVALLNCERAEAVGALLAHAHALLRRALALGARDAPRARVLTRFFAACAAPRVVVGGDALALLRALVGAAVAAAEDAGRPDGWQPRADALVYYALSALAFAGAELPDSDPEGLSTLFALVESYLPQRSHKGTPLLLRPLPPPPGGDEDDTGDDELEDLWTRICVSAHQKQWDAATLARARVHAPFKAHLTAACAPHALPPLEVPPAPHARWLDAHESYAGARAAFAPRPRLRVLAPERTEGADPSRLPLERFIAEELMADTLWAWEEGARAGGRLHMAAEQLAQGLPLDTPHEALLAETLFAHALSLPAPPFRPVYYSVVMQDLCTESASLSGFAPAWASVFGACFRRMADRAATGGVHPAAAATLAELLAAHLAAKEHYWPWERWAHAAAQPSYAPQRRFVTDVLQRLLRLSYHSRVALSLPEPLRPLLGPPHVAESGWRYGDDADAVNNPPAGGVDGGVARALLALARAKAPPDAMWSALADGAVPQLGARKALFLFATVLLFHGRKTITHLSTMLTRYAAPMDKLSAAAAAEAAGADAGADADAAAAAAAASAGAVILAAAAGFWAGSAQGLTVAVDRLLALGVVPIAAVPMWVFDDASRPLYGSGGVWTALESALRRAAGAAEAAAAAAGDAAAAAVDAGLATAAASDAAAAAADAAAAQPSAAADAAVAATSAAELAAVNAEDEFTRRAEAAAPAADAAAAALQALLRDVTAGFAAATAAAVDAADAAAAAAEADGAPPDAAAAAESALLQAVGVHDAFTAFAAKYWSAAGAAAPDIEAALAATPAPQLPEAEEAPAPAAAPAAVAPAAAEGEEAAAPMDAAAANDDAAAAAAAE
jgi:nuclear cap-binding protein subunit 1